MIPERKKTKMPFHQISLHKDSAPVVVDKVVRVDAVVDEDCSDAPSVQKVQKHLPNQEHYCKLSPKCQSPALLVSSSSPRTCCCFHFCNLRSQCGKRFDWGGTKHEKNVHQFGSVTHRKKHKAALRNALWRPKPARTNKKNKCARR